MKTHNQNDVRLLLGIFLRRIQKNGQLLVLAKKGEVRFAVDFKMGTTIHNTPQGNLRSC